MCLKPQSPGVNSRGFFHLALTNRRPGQYTGHMGILRTRLVIEALRLQHIGPVSLLDEDAVVAFLKAVGAAPIEAPPEISGVVPDALYRLVPLNPNQTRPMFLAIVGDIRGVEEAMQW